MLICSLLDNAFILKKNRFRYLLDARALVEVKRIKEEEKDH